MKRTQFNACHADNVTEECAVCNDMCGTESDSIVSLCNHCIENCQTTSQGPKKKKKTVTTRAVALAVET
jgi:hypothetical protein